MLTTNKNPYHLLLTSSLQDLAENEELDQVVGGQGSGTANTAQDIGANTLPERVDALLSKDLATSIDERIVLDGLECAGQFLRALSGDL